MVVENSCSEMDTQDTSCENKSCFGTLRSSRSALHVARTRPNSGIEKVRKFFHQQSQVMMTPAYLLARRSSRDEALHIAENT